MIDSSRSVDPRTAASSPSTSVSPIACLLAVPIQRDRGSETSCQTFGSRLARRARDIPRRSSAPRSAWEALDRSGQAHPRAPGGVRPASDLHTRIATRPGSRDFHPIRGRDSETASGSPQHRALLPPSWCRRLATHLAPSATRDFRATARDCESVAISETAATFRGPGPSPPAGRASD